MSLKKTVLKLAVINVTSDKTKPNKTRSVFRSGAIIVASRADIIVRRAVIPPASPPAIKPANVSL